MTLHGSAKLSSSIVLPVEQFMERGNESAPQEWSSQGSKFSASRAPIASSGSDALV